MVPACAAAIPSCSCRNPELGAPYPEKALAAPGRSTKERRLSPVPAGVGCPARSRAGPVPPGRRLGASGVRERIRCNGRPCRATLVHGSAGLKVGRGGDQHPQRVLAHTSVGAFLPIGGDRVLGLASECGPVQCEWCRDRRIAPEAESLVDGGIDILGRRVLIDIDAVDAGDLIERTPSARGTSMCRASGSRPTRPRSAAETAADRPAA